MDPKAFEAAGWSGELARLLAALEAVRLDELSFALPVAGFDELWEGVLGGTIRTARRLVAGGEAAREALREIAEPYRAGTGYALPTLIRIASGKVSPRAGIRPAL